RKIHIELDIGAETTLETIRHRSGDDEMRQHIIGRVWIRDQQIRSEYPMRGEADSTILVAQVLKTERIPRVLGVGHDAVLGAAVIRRAFAGYIDSIVMIPQQLHHGIIANSLGIAEVSPNSKIHRRIERIQKFHRVLSIIYREVKHKTP